jgi:hypothetical protein
MRRQPLIAEQAAELQRGREVQRHIEELARVDIPARLADAGGDFRILQREIYNAGQRAAPFPCLVPELKRVASAWAAAAARGAAKSVPKVEALPDDKPSIIKQAASGASSTQSGPGTLQRLAPEVKPNRREPFGVDNSQYDQYVYTESSATVTSVRSEGRVTFGWTFTGIPATLKKDDTVTITVNGTFSATPPSVGLGYRPMATVEAKGLKRISGTSPAMGNLSSGMKLSASSTYEFKVEDVAQAAITLYGDFGVSEIAVIRYAKKP